MVLLSDYEGLPLSLLEAMSCECTPVVTEVESGISEILRHEHDALMSPVRNIPAMVQNIIRLYHDRALCRKLGETARKSLFSHKLTASQMADQYSAIFDRIFSEIEDQTSSKKIPLDCPRVGSLLNAA